MKELAQWWSEINGSKSQWLILGKGPTLERKREFDLTPYRTVALNHVVREFPVDVASIIDLDVVPDCAEALDKNARFLLMPRYPHVKQDPTRKPLESFFGEYPILKKLDDEGRLVWYNLDTSSKIEDGSPTIHKGYFSAEVIVNLLATLGAKTIRTLGVDGGVRYSKEFQDLNEKTRLSTGHQNFDIQFAGIIRAVKQHSIDFAPLTSESPVRIYIGTDQSQLLGARVLEYSVLKHCPLPVKFDHMFSVQAPMPKDPKNQPRTGFSFNRFAIPRLAGNRGRAVYLDADMLVLRNFLDLWDTPFNGATVLYCKNHDASRVKQFSVLLMDCSRLDWDLNTIVAGLDAGKYDYEGLMKEFCIEAAENVRADLPAEWNSLERYEPGMTGLIHYTDMQTQPWVNRKNKNGSLWVQYLREALDSGYVSWKEVEEAKAAGFIRPSLVSEARSGGGLAFRMTAPFADAGFKPHKKLHDRLAKKS